MKQQKRTLTNNFHNTECIVYLRGQYLTKSQIKRSHKKLCGIKSCTCGDVAGCRPCQVIQVDETGTKYQIV